MSNNTVGRNTAEHLRLVATGHRTTQRQLAATLGLSQVAIHRRLHGATPLTVDDLVALSHALDLDPVAVLAAGVDMSQHTGEVSA